MRNQRIQQTAMVIGGIISTSILITIIDNKLLNTDRTFFYNFINYIFFVNLPCFIIGSLMLLTERGLFGAIVYSTNKVRSIVSKQYRYTLLESEDILEAEIGEHLKQKYLYRNNKFDWTFPIFVGTLTILIAIFLSVGIFYGYSPLS